MHNCEKSLDVISSLDDYKAVLYEGTPELLPLVDEMIGTLELTFFKVTAHFKEPNSFPLAVFHEGSLEMILAKRFEALNDIKKKVALTNIKCKQRSLDVLKKEKYANLVEAGVFDKIKSGEPIFESATEMFMKLGNDFKVKVAPGVLPPIDSMVEHLHPELDKVALRIHRIRCIDETNIESTSDSIDLASVVVRHDGLTTKIPPVRIGDNIGDGRTFDYGSWYYTTYDLWNPDKFQGFPKVCSCTFILSELDNGGLPEIVQDIYEKIRSEVAKAVGIAIGSAIGSFAGPIGTAVGAAVGYVLAVLFDLFKQWWEDDVFPPYTVSVLIPSFDARWTGSISSPVGRCYFDGHGGRYSIDYSWQFVR